VGGRDDDDIIVTIEHPFGLIEVPIAQWISTGPEAPGTPVGCPLQVDRHTVAVVGDPIALSQQLLVPHADRLAPHAGSVEGDRRVIAMAAYD
jgi:hypothetical protein